MVAGGNPSWFDSYPLNLSRRVCDVCILRCPGKDLFFIPHEGGSSQFHVRKNVPCPGDQGLSAASTLSSCLGLDSIVWECSYL